MRTCKPATSLWRARGARLAVCDRMEDVDERPRERLWRSGTHAIGDAELLSVVLGTGVRDHPALAVAIELVRSAGGVAILSRASPRELAQVIGVGAARAARVAAAFELGRRAIDLEQHRATVGRPEDVHRCVAARLAGLAQEVFLVIGVDIRNGLLDIVEVARGSVAGVEVHPREVFRPLVRMAAAGGVLVHNHPSGDPTPSAEDVNLTRRLREVGHLLGIPIIDHVVVGDRSFRSIAEWMGTEL
ncbi:MAG: repair protein RadC [Deltaproteobacteria bacterium]|nr:repair protein RadC [Deltaproteobacteria bacterium]